MVQLYRAYDLSIELYEFYPDFTTFIDNALS